MSHFAGAHARRFTLTHTLTPHTRRIIPSNYVLLMKGEGSEGSGPPAVQPAVQPAAWSEFADGASDNVGSWHDAAYDEVLAAQHPRGVLSPRQAGVPRARDVPRPQPRPSPPGSSSSS